LNRSPFLTVIVPTYNEKENMGHLLPALAGPLRQEGIPFEVLVMDDSAPDGTGGEVWRLSKDIPEARAIVRTKDRGLSPSVIDGFYEAKGDVLLVMDADLSHPVEAVPKLYRAIVDGGSDVAVGSRHAKGGSIEDWPFMRKFISWGASLMARPLTSCSDPMSGFFAVRRSVVEGAPLRAKGYKILLEVLVKGNYSKVSEVPITFRDRAKGESKLGSKVIINYLQHLVMLYLHRGSAPPIKFLFVGGTGFLLDLGLLTLLLGLVGDSTTEYIVFQSISFAAAASWNFIWNRYWTFNASKGRALRQYLRFFIVAVFAFAVRWLLARYIGVEVLGIDSQPYYQIMTVGVIVVVTVINFLGSKLWAFKTDPGQPR